MRLEQPPQEVGVVDAERHRADHARVRQDRVAQPLAETLQGLSGRHQHQPELPALVVDPDESARVEHRDLVDDEQVLPPSVEAGALATDRIDVVAADQHRPEQPRVVGPDL